MKGAKLILLAGTGQRRSIPLAGGAGLVSLVSSEVADMNIT
jgi:hypothetical protein